MPDEKTPPPPPEVPETIAAKTARLKALRLQQKEAVATRVARATRKARARRDILG